MIYEFTYIINPNFSEEQMSALKNKVSGFINQIGGQLKEEHPPTKRKLAYPIKKFDWGYYLTIDFSLEDNEDAEKVFGQKFKELEKFLNLEKDILRYLIVKKRFLSIRKIIPSTLKKKTKKIDKAKVKIEDLNKRLEEILK